MKVFCPKCGTLMRPVKQGDKVVLKCPKCGYTIENIDESIRKQTLIVSKRERIGDTIAVIDEVKFSDEVDDTVICPKCGGKGAFIKNYYDLSTDTGFTIYKCIHCGYTWREED